MPTPVGAEVKINRREEENCRRAGTVVASVTGRPFGGSDIFDEANGGLGYLMTGLIFLVFGAACAVVVLHLMPKQVKLTAELIW